MTAEPFDGASTDMTEDPPLTKDDACPVAGKYHKKPIRDIPLGYLNWLIQQEWLAGKYPEMQAYIENASPEDHIQALTDASPCPVRGKHHGTPMGQVPASYITWLMDQEWLEEKYPEIIQYYTANEVALQDQEAEEANAWAEARRRDDG
jgi:uncharacterized protein (DUF3820 family)